MTIRPAWEVDDATRDAWVAVLRRSLASTEVIMAPDGRPGWHLVAVRTPRTGMMSVFLWEPGAPKPQKVSVPTPGLTPTIILVLGFSGSSAIWGQDLRAPNMRTDQQTALTLVAHAGQALAKEW